MEKSIISHISEKANIPQEDVLTRINDKMNEFSGLVSEEGAAYLIAKEMGVDLNTETQKKDLKIENIVSGMRSVSIKAGIVEITQLNNFNKSDGSIGRVQNLILGDETGTIRMSLWDDQTELITKIKKGDSIEIKNAYSKDNNRGLVELRLGKKTIVKSLLGNPVKVIAQTGVVQNTRTPIFLVKQDGVKYEIEGTVLQWFTKNAFFYVCPTCNKRVTSHEGNVYTCEEHGEVTAIKHMVISTIIDDGSASIRCVFFRDVATKLIGTENINNYEELDGLSGTVLGKYINVKGRSKYNTFFNALELIVEDFSEVNVSEKLKNMVEVN